MQNTLLTLWGGMQRYLFPALEAECGPLTDTDQRFVQVLAVLGERFGTLVAPYGYGGVGRPPDARAPLARAFIAKSVYRVCTTAALIEALRARTTLRRLCGWDSAGAGPGEWTFSRAFGEFAGGELPQALHAALIADHVRPRLVGHISRDSTAVPARETVPLAPPVVPRPPRKRGRPRTGEERPAPPPKRLDLQPHRPLAENLADLPRHCAWGCKTNSQGKTEFWKGYKLHLDVADGDILISATLTAANLHDSQTAIPLAPAAARVSSLYDLMDSAYDAAAIHEYSRRLGHVPIIEPNPQRTAAVPLAPAAARRFDERTAVERVNGHLKDNYGGRWIRVRGASKGMCHLMFAVVALTAERLLHLVL